MYSAKKIPAPFCGNPCKKATPAAPAPEKTVCETIEPCKTQTAPCQPKKEGGYGTFPLFLLLLTELLLEKKEG